MSEPPINAEATAREIATMRALTGLESDEPIEYNDVGWDSRVYLARDGEIVFKFARTEEASEQYARETAILDALESHDLPCRVPQVQWRDPEAQYLGYLGVPGVALDTCIENMRWDERARIGATVGAFLRTFHLLELNGLPTVTVADDVADYRSKFALAAPAFARHCTPAERTAIATYFEEQFIPGLEAATEARMLVHGDLGPWNIIVGPNDTIGVIDFGDMAYHHRAKDFWLEDPGYAAGLFEGYGADARLREQAAQRAAAFPIYDLPYYLGKGLEDQVLERVARVRALVGLGPTIHTS